MKQEGHSYQIGFENVDFPCLLCGVMYGHTDNISFPLPSEVV